MKKVLLIIGGRMNAFACELRWHEHRKRLSGVGLLTIAQAKAEAAVAGLTQIDTVSKERVEVVIYTDSAELLKEHGHMARLVWLEMRHQVTWKQAQADVLATIAELADYAAAQEIVGAGERVDDNTWLIERMPRRLP